MPLELFWHDFNEKTLEFSKLLPIKTKVNSE